MRQRKKEHRLTKSAILLFPLDTAKRCEIIAHKKKKPKRSEAKAETLITEAIRVL